MAHYAFLNKNNMVTEVIVGIDETELIEGKSPEIWYGEFKNKSCKRTSYNNNYRGNYAGIGMFYCDEHNLFMWAKCHDEAVLNVEIAKWDCTNADHTLVK
jgi:hypothetical protein